MLNMWSIKQCDHESKFIFFFYWRQQSLFEQYRFKCDCDECMRQLNSLKTKSNSSLCCLKCHSSELTVGLTNEIIELKCPKCASTFAYTDYISLFERLNYCLSRLDTASTDKRQIAELTRLSDEYRRYLILDDLDKLNETFQLFYVDYSKLVDSLARLYCNVGDFRRACELVASNIRLLEKIYGQHSNNIELANELFKLAEIRCNCEHWNEALQSVNKAIRIAESVYSKDNSLIMEFYNLRQNILSIIK